MNRVVSRFLSSIHELGVISNRNNLLACRCRSSNPVTTYVSTTSLVRYASSANPVTPILSLETAQQDHVSRISHDAAAAGPVLDQEQSPAVNSSITLKENTYTESEEITVTGRDAPRPILSFADFEWPEEVTKVIQRQGFTKPTSIQSQGLPIALEGRDMVGIAQTGSGKTLSYIMPAIVRMNQESGMKSDPFALVLGPTRELVQQIQSVAEMFPSLRSVVLYGGSAKGFQITDLRRQPKMLVATPGRLIDLMDSNFVSIDRVKYLVLDEADRMLDMGFEPQIRNIIDRIPAEGRQTLMWSATWPDDVQDLARDFLNDYIQVNIGGTELHANHNIKQHVAIMQDEDKSSALMEVLKSSSKGDKVLIFASTKRRVDAIVSGLRRRGYRAEGTHGDKSMNQRESILRAFRGDRLDILVATDVAARGLDVDDIKIVINYDFPNTCEDYVHRIGRTGRRDNKGNSFTFMTRDNIQLAPELIDIMREAGQYVPEELESLANEAKRMKKGKKSFRSGFEPTSYHKYGSAAGRPSRRYEDTRYINRHNASQHNDRDYQRWGPDAYQYQRYNRNPSSFVTEDDLPDGGNERGYKSKMDFQAERQEDMEFEGGGGRRSRFAGNRTSHRNDEDRFDSREDQFMSSQGRGMRRHDEDGGYGRSSGRQSRNRDRYEDEDDDGSYGHSDDTKRPHY